MTVKTTASTTYDANTEKVFATFVDPEAIVARFEAMGDRDVEVVRCEADGEDWFIETKRLMDVDLPGFAKKVLSPTNEVRQIDTWGPADADGARTGSMKLETKGAPVESSGKLRIGPSGDGCLHEVELAVKVKVPLIGSKIEKWSVGTSGEKLEAEFAYNAARLAGE